MINRISIHMAENCNLNCMCCDNFSPIAKEEYLKPESLEMDLGRFKEIQADCGTFFCSGGEPLLSPYISENILLLREFFPKANIQIITNGILVKKMNSVFWETCKRTETEISFTRYPIKIEYEQLFFLCEHYHVKHSVFNDGDMIKTSYYMPFDLKGEESIEENLKDCYHFSNCVQMYHGKIFGCSIAANVHHFNRFFKMKLPCDDYIDIYKVENEQEIIDFLHKPLKLCRYCKIKNRTYDNPWGISTLSIKEWTC